MKIAFIIPYLDITAYGVRMLSSCMMKAGHQRRLIFLPFGDELGNYEYPEHISEIILPLIKDYDITGFSLMTNHYTRMTKLAKELRGGTSSFFVFGGIHPTVDPSSCFPYADAVAVGEAENSFLELISRMQHAEDFMNIAGFHFLSSGSIRENPAPELIEKLDELPDADYSLADDWIIEGDKEENAIQITEFNFKKFLDKGYISRIKPGTAYQTMTSRGCPHTCSYCCNDAFKNNIYKGQKYLRTRSLKLVIDELKSIRQRFPFIEVIGLSDDSFFINSFEKLEEFSKLYKKEINLPFFCLGSPLTITEEKMEVLVDAGLLGLQMGIQTGSDRINELYFRKISRDKVLHAAEIINKYKDRIKPPAYDFIINNPWETLKDRLESLRLVRELPKPFHPQVFSLVLFPGTKLYEKAKTDSNISKDFLEYYKTGYEWRSLDYINFLWALHVRHLPLSLLSILSLYTVAFFFSLPVIRSLFAFFYWIGRKLFGIK
ncbi:MAG: B12-binding domain-containing radical SAM protein [Candidatus Coatesbacteria bacterium]|nr:B12-binding domain-containing radical SAM protein [Candidatus Coatesbacteria bacterium]